MKQDKEFTWSDLIKFVGLTALILCFVFSINQANRSIASVEKKVVQVITVDSIIISRLDTMKVNIDSLVKMVSEDTYMAE